MSAKAVIQRQRTGKRLSVEPHVGCAVIPQTGVGINTERKCSRKKADHMIEPFSIFSGEIAYGYFTEECNEI